METQRALVDVVTCNAVLTAIGTQADASKPAGSGLGWMGETDGHVFEVSLPPKKRISKMEETWA